MVLFIVEVLIELVLLFDLIFFDVDDEVELLKVGIRFVFIKFVL